MIYKSVDALQKVLAKEVFFYAKDAKKASGRALGTLVELITFYLIKNWGLENNLRIEKRLIEYSNASVAHNVEYSLHPIEKIKNIIVDNNVPITSTKIFNCNDIQKYFELESFTKVNSTILSSSGIIKNACVIGRSENSTLVSVVKKIKNGRIHLMIIQQYEKPFAMVECKRVGIEDGIKKGPQTIEKAKQGAYVARTVSSLQKIRNSDGVIYGVLPIGNNQFRFDVYETILHEIIQSKDLKEYKDFILTIGVVSNHGNWFTSDNPNKELAVLKNSYDWLIFLTDKGISSFIEELLLKPSNDYIPVRKAFLKSYKRDSKKTIKNQFTKSQIDKSAEELLQNYFKKNRKRTKSWFNIITPENSDINELKTQLEKLSIKRWV